MCARALSEAPKADEKAEKEETMMKAFRSMTLAALATLVLALGVAAQTPPSGAFIAGPVTAVSGDTLTVQGLTLNVTQDSKFFSVAPDGTLEEVPFSSVQAGVPIHGRFIYVEGIPTVTHMDLGDDFFWHGTVTATGDATLTLDNTVTIHTGQARLVGKGSLQVGDTVGVTGEVLDGVFAARWINTNGIDFDFKGQVGSVVRDGSGHVTGFTLAQGSTSYLVVLDEKSVVRRGRFQVPPDVLAAGMAVRVTGWVLPDSTVLAWNVVIK
jgi:hypothetical protein